MKRKENNDEDTVGNLLFYIEDIDLETTKKMLQGMWNKCKRIEKRIEKRKEIMMKTQWEIYYLKLNEQIWR